MASSSLRLLAVFLACVATAQAFLPSIPSATGIKSIKTPSHLTALTPSQPLLVPLGGRGARSAALMKREVIPQLLFAAACAGAVIGYVATHIDEIK